MRKLKILIVGNDVEALLAGHILSKHYNVKIVSHVYQNIELHRDRLFKSHKIRWKEEINNYLSYIPFTSTRNRNIESTKEFKAIIDELDLSDDSYESIFEQCKGFGNLEDKVLKDVIDSGGSLYSVYDGNKFLSIDKFLTLNKEPDKLKKYIDKLWPKGYTSKYVFSDPEIMASQKLLRVNCFDLCRRLIDELKPEYYDTLSDPKCEGIEHLYDYVFFTGKMAGERYSLAYHNTFEIFNMHHLKMQELYKYDNIYFNDDSNILRIYSNGDMFHVLMKFEHNKGSKDYNEEVESVVGDCIFTDRQGLGRVIQNHLIRESDKFITMPNKNNRKENECKIVRDSKKEQDHIYSKTSLGFVESPDMFVNSVHRLVEVL